MFIAKNQKFWKLPKLKVEKIAKIAESENCHHLKLPKLEIAKVKKLLKLVIARVEIRQYWRLTKMKIDKIEN